MNYVPPDNPFPTTETRLLSLFLLKMFWRVTSLTSTSSDLQTFTAKTRHDTYIEVNSPHLPRNLLVRRKFHWNSFNPESLCFVEHSPVRILSRPLQFLTSSSPGPTITYRKYSHNLHFLPSPLISNLFSNNRLWLTLGSCIGWTTA